MALKNKIMTADEARTLRDIHRETWEAMEAKKSWSGVYGSIVYIAGLVNRFRKFIGPIGNVSGGADIIWGISQRSNNSANISYFKGAEIAFTRVRDILLAGNYLRAEVQMVWIKYPSVSTTCEFVQGNEHNPGRGYKILRYQTSDGRWVDAPGA